jgi:hypothetical protein
MRQSYELHLRRLYGEEAAANETNE